jgi:bifunctional non-homologous end joining protein LigD
MTELHEYNRKRDFEKTAEPAGETAEPGESLRFAVQHHLARRDHYDLRLEWGGVLWSWAVPKGPSFNPRDKRLAVQVENHPLEYRHFEGTIPKGEYGGGAVMLWDEGFWEPFGDAEEGLRDGALKFLLRGRRLKGKWALVRLKGKEGETKDNWLLLKEKDEYAKSEAGISAFTASVRTGRTMAEIEEGADDKRVKNPFGAADAQLAKLVTAVPDGGDWLYEMKYDGYRILAYLEGGGARLITRNGRDYTGRFPGVASSLADWAAGRAMVLDGEMTVTDDAGKTDFQALQNAMKKAREQRLTYIVFDLLALDGVDLRGERLIQRKEALEALMKDTPENLWYSRHVRGNGKESLAAACGLGMEGIVGKRADSVYSGTRNGDWIKLKCNKRQEFVIGGYALTDKKTSGLSSLLLGVYDGGELLYTGRAGTGWSESDAAALQKKLEGIRRPDSPFKTAPKARPNEEITWVEPQLVAEIRFAEMTKERLLRQASFKGLRTDKSPREVKMEGTEDEPPPEPTADDKEERPVEAEKKDLIIGGVKITHPDKVLFDDPPVTKEDLIRYYEKVSARMLPYVSGRILSIVRCPKGVSETCFYKKHPGPGSKGIVTVPVLNSEGETEEYFYIDSALGLISEAQMGTLEFHTWGSRVDALEKPDVMVFDLDPDEGMALDRVRQGVRDLQGILSELSLPGYLKTSGGKGYHVVVPFRPAASWDAFHDFARRIAEVMERKWPERYTSNVRKGRRTDKIFIDWIRNGRGATSVAPYSIRARKGARVSMPITWEELDTVAPDGVDMPEALRRVGLSDPWKDFFESGQILK